MLTQDAFAISVSDLTYRFGENIVIERLTFHVAAGEVFGLLGHNGAGKTTTIRLLNGLLQPEAGQMRVMGFDPGTQGPLLRRHTGVLTETPSLEEQLSARDNLRIFARLYDIPRTKIAQRVEELLGFFDLATHANAPVGSYSKGMKLRLALARALLHDPQVLFLDEPTDGMDPVAAQKVHQLIVTLSRDQKRTIMLCTHNLAEAQRLCDHIAILQHGSLQALGTPQDLTRQLTGHITPRLDLELLELEVPHALVLIQAFPDLLAQRTGTTTLSIHGARRDIIPTLIETMAAEKISLYKVHPHEPTLEDVYFALHGKERDA
jgi:ABC-2 type transport system ATP-binding protein